MVKKYILGYKCNKEFCSLTLEILYAYCAHF